MRTLTALLTLAVVLGFAPPASAHPHPAPRGKLVMTGAVGDFVPGVIDDPVHDPTLFDDGHGTFYVFSTGVFNPADPGGIFARRSRGSLAGPWESLGALALPEWTRAYGVNHLWAPHVVKTRGWFYLYYAASSFGSNRSAIGAARTRTPGVLSSWQDLGPILTSDPSVNYNAIDPMVFSDGRGWWIAFGSFWDGLKMQRLTGMTHPVGDVVSLARHPVNPPNPIENPQLFHHGRYWYLLAAWDFCCQGVNSTYKTIVGRATKPTGPFVDRTGKRLLDGGGTILLQSRGNQIGTGAPDVEFAYGRWYMVHHYYDANANGVIRMQIREIEWDRQGWPLFSGEQ